MKVRGTTLGAKLTALCWGALTLLAPVGLAACSSSSPTAPTIPSFSPTVSVSGSVTVTAPASNPGTSPSDGSTQTATPHPTHTVTTTVTPTVTVTPTATAHSATPTPTPTEPATPAPIAAPVTGGGGTAGFQDTLLLVAGLAAIVAGAGSIFYRRRINRGG